MSGNSLERFIFNFDENNQILSVYEIDEHGGQERDWIEPGETYELIDGQVIKTEMEHGVLVTTVFTLDPVSGYWTETSESGSPEGSSETPTSGYGVGDGDRFIFEFDATGTSEVVP